MQDWRYPGFTVSQQRMNFGDIPTLHPTRVADLWNWHVE